MSTLIYSHKQSVVVKVRKLMRQHLHKIRASKNSGEKVFFYFIANNLSTPDIVFTQSRPSMFHNLNIKK